MGIWRNSRGPQPPFSKNAHSQTNLLDQDSAELRWDPVLSIRDHPPRLPAQLSGLSTYQLSGRQHSASGLNWRSAGGVVARSWAQRTAQSLACRVPLRAAAGPSGVGARSELCALPAPSSRLSPHKARPPAICRAPRAHGRQALAREQGCSRAASVILLPQFFLSGEGFRFQRFRHSPRHLPSLPPGLDPPHSEAGDCGDWE